MSREVGYLLFPTITFAIFFVLVFGGAWALRHDLRTRKVLLLAASYVFYGWWDWRFCFLLFAVSLTAWLAGLGLAESKSVKVRRLVLGCSVGVLLIILGFFKYYGFFLASLQDLLFALNLQRDLPFLQIVLPVGISFFTFQAVSYIVDVDREKLEARRSPLDVLLYISFFPQLVAGPIVRASDFLPQLQRVPALDQRAVCFGLTLCALGLFKKMVIAHYLASDLVDPVFLNPGAYSSLVLLAGVYGYAVQIYCDFSGYSDIAIGCAAFLGFRFKKNFDQPYRATSLQDFWRRWHISLSQWLRDYLYIPLGGSRHGVWNTRRNLFLTMFLGGLWHGAAWTFIIWGSLHGAWLVLERALSGNNREPQTTYPINALLSWLITFHVVCAGWVFFRADSLDVALDWFSTLAEFRSGLEGLTWFLIPLIAGPLAAQFLPALWVEKISLWLSRRPFALSAILFVVILVVTIWLSPAGTSPFIYFQF